MNDNTPRTGLGAVLDRATDQIDRPLLAAAVLAEARRRRLRSRIVAGAGVAASLVVVIGAVRVLGHDEVPPSTEPATPSLSLTEPDTTSEVRDAVQPRWDPFTVAGDPFHETVLPERLEPPATAPSVVEEPMRAAVVAWPEEGEDLRLLGVDGAWRSVPGTAEAVTGTLYDVVAPALSSDGEQVAMSTNAGILVVDVTSGEERTVPWPDALAGPWDTAPNILWLPDDTGFAVLHWRDTWLVEPGGRARKAPYGGPYGGGLAVDPAGPVVERRWEHDDLRVWQGGRLSSTAPFPYWGERLSTQGGRVALTGGGNGLPGDSGPMVVDAASGRLIAYAPIRDPNAVYSDNGHLTAQGFLDDDTVLLLVGPTDFRTMDVGEEAWHLVAWNTRTGGFERLASGDSGMRGIDVATAVLAADWES